MCFFADLKRIHCLFLNQFFLSKKGFNGKNCSNNINECEFKPCFNNATCIDQTNSFTCNCTDGFKGKKCEIDINECKDDPCKNGGACIDEVCFYKIKI